LGQKNLGQKIWVKKNWVKKFGSKKIWVKKIWVKKIWVQKIWYNPKVTEGKKKKELSNKNNKRKLKEAKISDIKIKPKLKGELLKEKSAKQFNTTELFSCLKFDHIQNEFQCMICNKTTSGKSIKTGRKNLLRHIKLMHNK